MQIMTQSLVLGRKSGKNSYDVITAGASKDYMFIYVMSWNMRTVAK